MNTPASRERLLLIDGHSVAFRAFFGLPPENFTTSSGQHTNAVFGFTSMLISLLRDVDPTHCAVAFDISRATFRSAQYPGYKAQRDATPPEFKGQTELIRKVLDALKIRHLDRENYEADDIIATLATRGAAAGQEVLICSGDRDTIQLVTDDVTVLYPRRGVSDLVRLTPEAVEEKYLVKPSQYPELAALVGETSDNLPGVPGVGPKTAAKWIRLYGGLPEILAAAPEIKGKVGESLRNHIADVERNRELNALVRDLDLPVTTLDLELGGWESADVDEVFAELEFRQLRSRLDALHPNGAPTPELEIEIDSLPTGGVARWLSDRSTSRVALACVQMSGHPGTDAEALIIATDTHAAYIDLAEIDSADDAAIAALLANPDCEKVLHGSKRQLQVLWSRGWQLEGSVRDTKLASYILQPEARSYEIADLAQRYLRITLEAGEESLQESLLADVTAERAFKGHETATLLVLDETLTAQLKQRQSAGLANDIEFPLAKCLARLEVAGIAVASDELDRLHDQFDARVSAATQAAHEAIGHEVNLASPKQLQGVLFEELGMPKTRRTKSGYTTDADALEWLFTQTQHPFLAHLLEHRDAIRLRQTVAGLSSAIADDGRIHTTFLQTAAATGRLSSVDPNLQNIPIRTAAGREIRKVFVAGDGYEGLLTADYSQIEMRLMAHMSGDAGLIDSFRQGSDFHSQMAAIVFGVDPANVSLEQRSKIKAMNYGLAYGLSAFGLSKQLRIGVPEAKHLMDEYFARFGTAQNYLHQVVADAVRCGYTETMWGRRRYLPDLTSSNRALRENAERAALNAPIQGSAADIIKLAMLSVQRAMDHAGLASRMLLQVHDELIFEVAPGEREGLEKLVSDEMRNAANLAVDLDVSLGFGRSWHEAAH